MTEFYKSQPAELPLTLPKGTRSKSGETALSELRLTDGRYVGRWRSSWNGDYEGSLHVANVVWTEAPITPPIKDRPIRAGDWVECVNLEFAYPSDLLRIGGCYQVVDLKDGELVVCGYSWLASRFKRVDGPHPVTTEEPGAYEPMECCGLERDQWGGPNPHCE